MPVVIRRYGYQVFKKDGTFVKEMFLATKTLGDGSVWDAGFSTDPQQTFLYNPDGQNRRVWTLLRQSGQVVGTFGGGIGAIIFTYLTGQLVDTYGSFTGPFVIAGMLPLVAYAAFVLIAGPIKPIQFKASATRGSV